MTGGRTIRLVPRGKPHVRRFRFGTFELDVELGELRQDGARLPLHGQPLEALELLLSSPGELVSREELRRALWPDGTIVEFDDSLNNCVGRLRHALGDDATQPTFIETIPRRGYRFLGKVTAEPGAGATAGPPAAAASSAELELDIPAGPAVAAPHADALEPHPPAPEPSGLPRETASPRLLPTRSRQWRRFMLPTALLGTAVLTVAYLVAGRAGRSTEGQVRRLTTRRGLIYGGRFAPGADRVILSAAWEGEPTQPYVLSVASREMRPLGIPDARVLAVSPAGEVALSLHPRREGSVGLLAIVPDVGGVPREVLENVSAADWSPDGKQLAVVRYVGGKCRLEFPIGTVIYETAGQILSPRVSRRGEVAFARHPANSMAGDLLVWEPSGNVRTLVEGWGQKGAGVTALDWAPSDEEIWFTGNREEYDSHSLWAVTRSGSVRLVLAPVGSVWLMDIAPDGRALLQHVDRHTSTEVFGLGSDQPRQVWDSTELADLARDGSVLTFGFTFTDARLRKLDGSPPVHLGNGMPLALSPDGQWALVQRWEGSNSRGRLFLLPVGKGIERSIPIEGLDDVTVARWFPDGARIAIAAREGESSGHRFYVLDLNGGRPHPLSPAGVRAAFLAVSPDGKLLAGVDRQGLLALFPVDGGEPRAIPGMKQGLVPVAWSKDGGLLVIPEATTRPVLSRVDVGTGKIDPITTLEPADPVGILGIRRVRLTPDERTIVFGYARATGYVNLVESPRAP